MKHTNSSLSLLFILLLICSSFYVQHQQILKLESGNKHYNFNINLTNKTFLYNEINNINRVFNKSSHGVINIIGDTIILQSDYNLNKIPLTVDYKTNRSDIKKNMIIVDRENQILLQDTENLYLIINDKDTINIISDTTQYNGLINKFFIIIKNRDDNYLSEYYNKLPKELLTEKDIVIVSNLNRNLGNRLKTETFFNNDYGTIKVSLNVNVDLWNYQSINDTIIKNDDIYLWYSILFKEKKVLRLSL